MDLVRYPHNNRDSRYSRNQIKTEEVNKHLTIKSESFINSNKEEIVELIESFKLQDSKILEYVFASFRTYPNEVFPDDHKVKLHNICLDLWKDKFSDDESFDNIDPDDIDSILPELDIEDLQKIIEDSKIRCNWNLSQKVSTNYE